METRSRFKELYELDANVADSIFKRSPVYTHYISLDTTELY